MRKMLVEVKDKRIGKGDDAIVYKIQVFSGQVRETLDDGSTIERPATPEEWQQATGANKFATAVYSGNDLQGRQAMQQFLPSDKAVSDTTKIAHALVAIGKLPVDEQAAVTAQGLDGLRAYYDEHCTNGALQPGDTFEYQSELELD